MAVNRRVVSSSLTCGANIINNLRAYRVPVYAREGVEDLPVTNLQKRTANLHLMLLDLAYKYNIAIGFEVADDDDLPVESEKVVVEIANGKIKDVLNSLVNQDKRYTWTAGGGTINVFPTESHRNSFNKKLLETKLGIDCLFQMV